MEKIKHVQQRLFEFMNLGRTHNNNKNIKGQIIKYTNKHMRPWEIWNCILIVLVTDAGPAVVAVAPAALAVAVAAAHLAKPKQYP